MGLLRSSVAVDGGEARKVVELARIARPGRRAIREALEPIGCDERPVALHEHMVAIRVERVDVARVRGTAAKGALAQVLRLGDLGLVLRQPDRQTRTGQDRVHDAGPVSRRRYRRG